MKYILRVLALVVCTAPFLQVLYGQKIHTIIKNDSTATPLSETDRVFVCNNDSLLLSIPSLKILGKAVFVGKKGVAYGIDVHAKNVEKRARKWGSNFIRIDSYITSKRYDSLFVTLYYAPKEFLKNNLESCADKQLIVVNASSKKEKVIEIDQYVLELPPDSFHRYDVEKDVVVLSLGKGFLTTSGEISFKKLDCRYFKIGGYGLNGAPPGGGIGLGVKSPELTELSRFTAELYMDLLSEF